MNLFLLLICISNLSTNRHNHSNICESRFRVLPHGRDTFGLEWLKLKEKEYTHGKDQWPERFDGESERTGLC